MPVPNTSVSLLKDLARGSSAARWAEFVRRYESFMRGYVSSRFPGVDADDVLQETYIALTKAIPGYKYTPDGKGYFHNYIVGILKHKAQDAVRQQASESAKRRFFSAERPECAPRAGDGGEEGGGRAVLLNAALEQLMAAESIPARNREIFRHVALLHESPQEVADMFGTTRGNVDVIKKRMIARLSALVRAMREPLA